MKILVTGTAGFIGSHLALRLVERGDEVIGLDNINDYYDVNVKYGRLQWSGIIENLEDGKDIEFNKLITSKTNPNYKFIKMDLEDKDSMMKLFENEKFDAVCHLAAQAGVRYSLINPDAYMSSNIIGFMNILECCRHNNVKNLSYASSSSVYGSNTKLPFSTKDNVDHPISLYAASKKSNELMAHTYSHLFGISTTGLRFFTVYGPWGRPDMALFLFTKATLEGKTIDVFNNGDMLRDFTYIDDIVKGIVTVLDNPPKLDRNWNSKMPNSSTSSAKYKIYNIGNSTPIKLMDFIDELEIAIGKKIDKNMMPMQDGDIKQTFANVEELINLGYKSTTDYRVGIKKFVKWYKEFYYIDK